MLLKTLIEFSADQPEFAELGFHIEEFNHV